MIVVPDDEVFTKESTNQTFPEATIEDAPLAVSIGLPYNTLSVDTHVVFVTV